MCGLTGAHGCAAAKPRKSPRLEKVLSFLAQTPALPIEPDEPLSQTIKGQHATRAKFESSDE
nr:MAG TPA_asm: hypothetical protein [Caudoviricetes sp.]